MRYKLLEKSMLKTSKITKDEIINFIETKCTEADEKKYAMYSSYIIIAHMINEYTQAKDSLNLSRWLYKMDRHKRAKENPAYIINYFKGERYLECGDEVNALKYLMLCYYENPNYPFTRVASCYKFLNANLDRPHKLPNEKVDE
ncbi:hypothetical protein KDD93_06665 [Campylobacter sp. faydin G-24]|uniref:Uncharacterized protein n=1 Tax=Campylobacter anatolicus TaxID=2829105 RepID=A0ABS5HKW7_9BACT|nr:hypothetical protein [Campylobacter anatolicus]MBR8464242.1 hypothetical protein [Campylobacter anatolicus]